MISSMICTHMNFMSIFTEMKDNESIQKIYLISTIFEVKNKKTTKGNKHERRKIKVFY